jgi:glycosyltransferase involved in cell wall biosynthesis
MMCGIPLITNVSAELVKEFGLGIIVDYDKVQEVKSAIALLRENGELRQRLRSNGRKAFLEKYNWVKME